MVNREITTKASSGFNGYSHFFDQLQYNQPIYLIDQKPK